MSSLPLPIAAFFAGLISFLSPCVLPLVPGYVSLISGAGVDELKSSQGRLMRRVMMNSVGFILGFSVVFITLGAISTEIGQIAAQYKHTLAIVAGVVIILFGLHLTGILTLAAAQDTLSKGMLLLAVYSLGLAVPFLLTALGVERFLKFYSRFRSHMHALEVASGALLIGLGVLLVLGRFTMISNWLSFLNRFAL